MQLKSMALSSFTSLKILYKDPEDLPRSLIFKDLHISPFRSSHRRRSKKGALKNFGARASFLIKLQTQSLKNLTCMGPYHFKFCKG